MENDPVTLGFKPELIIMQKKLALEWIGANIPKVVDGYLNNEYINGMPKTLPVLVRIYHDKNTSYKGCSFSSSYVFFSWRII